MEVRERRRRMTLYDQLSATAAVELPSSSPNLGDLLKVRQEEDLERPRPPPPRAACGRRSASISLGTFLACEKLEPAFPDLAAAAAAAAAIGSRTLLDIIRDEDESNGGGGVYDGVVGGGDSGHRISWRTAFRDRLRIHRAGNPADGVTLAFPAATSPSRIPAPQNNPVRAIVGDATLPETPTTAAADVPNAAASGGERAEGSGRGSLPSTVANAETQQQPPQQVRVSLMALLDETDRHGGGPGFAVSALLEGVCEEEEEEDEDGKGGRQYLKCCVCMVRQKGAAFIPCGHTFCRLCCRELWVSRGSCPLCNGFILEVLDIF